MIAPSIHGIKLTQKILTPGASRDRLASAKWTNIVLYDLKGWKRVLRLTKLADYGLVLLAHMATHGDRKSYKARDLADATQLPHPTVSKVLKRLVQGGLVVSHRGVKGGYRLAHSPEKIVVAEILVALEGPIAITECLQAPEGVCQIERRCPVRTNWGRVNEVVRRALEGITLSDMTRPLFMPEGLLGAGERPSREEISMAGQAVE
jgi:FeS assembly SUF system regulator